MASSLPQNINKDMKAKVYVILSSGTEELDQLIPPIESLPRNTDPTFKILFGMLIFKISLLIWSLTLFTMFF